MLIRETFAHPIIAIATTPSEREQRKLYRAKADAVIDRTLAMSVFSALFDQRTWAYQNAPTTVATPIPAAPPTTTYQLGTITVDPTNYTVTKNGQALNLTKKEFQLLVYLLEHQNQVLSREQLLNGVWGYDLLGTSRIVDIHISHLRDKLEDDPKQPQWLKTVRGFGYRLEK
ncbi:winged helix-turn-helix transcriptional regulator [Lactobacillus ingluviei]|nr:winged helix-turn-helix transcriptional regulator [Limosilactobacillus ingluviei]